MAALTFAQVLLAMTLASLLTHVSLIVLMGQGGRLLRGLDASIAWLNADPYPRAAVASKRREPFRDPVLPRPRRAGGARPPQAYRPRRIVRRVRVVEPRESPPAQRVNPFPSPVRGLHAVGVGGFGNGGVSALISPTSA